MTLMNPASIPFSPFSKGSKRKSAKADCIDRAASCAKTVIAVTRSPKRSS